MRGRSGGAGRKPNVEAELRCRWKKKPGRSPARWPPQRSRRKARSVKRRSQRRHVAASMKRLLTLPTRERTWRRTSSGNAAMMSLSAMGVCTYVRAKASAIASSRCIAFYRRVKSGD
ncbi:hypothetical protein OsJ_00407 [Oryza sativa Japonica Group]|uniref:Uncharacterized protein n=1 Tax=Oryza sativa subsp. japonica TaxID=39947 RepID=B9ESX2_ORYSJ|nr:hypothetical protein OsJ_00407 [Oryza sativa Japonica Group]